MTAPDSEPTVKLAEALRELATAAYGDADATWDSPQTLVRDALRQTKVLTITPQMVDAAIYWQTEVQHEVIVISPSTPASQIEPVMDRWMLGLLTAALLDVRSEDMKPLNPLTLDDMALEQYNTPRNTITFHLLVKGEEVAKREVSLFGEKEQQILEAGGRILLNTWMLEDEAERAKQWVESVAFIFGDEAKPYLGRLKL